MAHSIPLLSTIAHLRRWQCVERLRNLRLPAHLGLAEDLSSRLQVLASVEEDGTDDDLIAHDGLVVVDMGGAIGAVVAVDRLACWWKGKVSAMCGLRLG